MCHLVLYLYTKICHTVYEEIRNWNNMCSFIFRPGENFTTKDQISVIRSLQNTHLLMWYAEMILIDISSVAFLQLNVDFVWLSYNFINFAPPPHPVICPLSPFSFRRKRQWLHGAGLAKTATSNLTGEFHKSRRFSGDYLNEKAGNSMTMKFLKEFIYFKIPNLFYSTWHFKWYNYRVLGFWSARFEFIILEMQILLIASIFSQTNQDNFETWFLIRRCKCDHTFTGGYL